MAITKNRQSEAVIRRMVQNAFPKKQMASYTELTEGMCNTAYMINFADGSRSVLKIATKGNIGRMSNEVNLMEAEVTAMGLVSGADVVKVAQIQYYDKSNKICDSHYFFMEALEGESLSSVAEQFSEEERAVINYEIGQAERRISSIQGETFGLLGDAEHTYETLYDFVYMLISNVLSDAEKKGVIFGVSSKEILDLLQRFKTVFDNVKTPVLVHWDMWEGNIFVKDGHISGIIDWERAMWGEPFMDDRFRRHTRNKDFLRGFGKEEFTAEEMSRILWYDILLYLTMMTEGAYREYEDDGLYQWTKPFFEASWKELQKVIL